jgi:dihydrofolate reductase
VTDEVGFAEKMNSMPKYVVSSTLESADWNNSTVINGDVAEEVAKLDGNILVAGSAQLVQTLMDHDLVDEYRLMIYPVLLGSGKRLFKDGVDTTALQIVETNQTGQVATVVLQRAA